MKIYLTITNTLMNDFSYYFIKALETVLIDDDYDDIVHNSDDNHQLTTLFHSFTYR